MFEPLKVGDKIELTRKTALGKGEDDKKDTYNSQVVDLTDDAIVCTMPFFEGRLYVLEVGMRLEAFFYTSKGMYNVDCVVSGRGKEDNIYTVSLKTETNLKKFQRREFFRLDCTIQVVLKPMSEDEETYYQEKKELPKVLTSQGEHAIIVDISGGGLRVFAKTKYEKNSIVEVTFPIVVAGKEKLMRLAGRLVMSLPSPNRREIFDNRIQFLNMSKEQTEEIVKFIFEQQRLMRKKERG